MWMFHFSSQQNHSSAGGQDGQSSLHELCQLKFKILFEQKEKCARFASRNFVSVYSNSSYCRLCGVGD